MFSPDYVYRYVLERRGVGGMLGDYLAGRRLTFIMLNPSTADAFKSDPTVTRCLGYAAIWGYDHLTILNLFAYRSTDPRLLLNVDDPIGPLNDRLIVSLVQESQLIVCAWGNHGLYLNRGEEVRQLIVATGLFAYALAVNKTGEPKHPLYCPAAIKREDLVSL